MNFFKVIKDKFYYLLFFICAPVVASASEVDVLQEGGDYVTKLIITAAVLTFTPVLTYQVAQWYFSDKDAKEAAWPVFKCGALCCAPFIGKKLVSMFINYISAWMLS